ncbi:MAG: histidine kinase [Bacteroidales bacterium]|nr:histidine kinase [Bacteroidales bacterium]MCD8393512.1 histidine kinase [Bacteroidales bacterium]
MKLLKSLAPYAAFVAIVLLVVIDNGMSGRGDALFPFGFPWRLFTIYALIMVTGATFAGLVLAPRYLFKGRKRAYITGLLVEVAVLCYIGLLIQYYLDKNDAQLMSEMPWQAWLINGCISFVLNLLAFAGLTTFLLVEDNINKQREITEARQFTRLAELATLRRQVSPHFIFNMLNNIITLLRIDPVQGADLIGNLRTLMGYQLTECNRDFMPLEQEVAHLRQFLDIEKVRRDEMSVKFISDSQLGDMEIPSLLLLPLVENAVKHNLPEGDRVPFVHVNIGMDQKGNLSFRCTNSVGGVKGSPGGLGLKGVRRRLELVYPDRHSFEINETPDNYTISLTIQP